MNKITRKLLRACHLYDAVVDVKHWLTGTEAAYVRFYSQFFHSGDLCFDVGANVGRRTRVLLRLHAKVVAVEPQERCMKILRRKFGSNANVTLVEAAVGEKPGQAQLQLCDSHSLSSLSAAWIQSVRASGRYAQCTWQDPVTIQVTTLDQLVAQYGMPTFVKLDVEGYEYEALKGLSRPIPCVCFEFTPEFIASARNCVDHLARLGSPRFNYCLENAPTSLQWVQWEPPSRMVERLDSLSSQGLGGDIYARFSR
jgi:FkbM family methyltransferase